MSMAVSDLRKNGSPAPRALTAFGSVSKLSKPAPPTADAVLLVFLLSVVLLMASVAWIVHCLAQPTVLVNAGAAAFEREQRPPIIPFIIVMARR
jgi:hypothetical protein